MTIEVDPFVSERERRDLLSSSESDSEGDSDCEEPPAKRKFTPGEDTIQLLKQAAEKPLKNDKRKAIAGKFPLPSCDAAHPPRLDDSLNCLVPKSAKTYDRFLSKLQQFSMDALGPLAFIQNQLDRGKSPDQETLRGAVKSAVTLVGNAAAHFSHAGEEEVPHETPQ